jgi:tetratricopeptide (TPR) repeat protein
MATARQLLTENQPAQAVKMLEAVLPLADGDAAYLELLRRAYQAELAHWEQMGSQDSRVERLRRYIDLLQPPPLPHNAGNNNRSSSDQSDSRLTTPLRSLEQAAAIFPQPASVTVPADDDLRQAIQLFQQQRYQEAAQRFARIPHLSAEYHAAWAYCRIRLAVEQLRQPQSSAAARTAAIKELKAAQELLPPNSQLRQYVEQLIQTLPSSIEERAAESGSPYSPQSDGVKQETANFSISGKLSPENLATLGRLAEQYRHEAFELWSGPACGNWHPKCQLVVHRQPEDFQQATGAAAGHGAVARVALQAGQVIERRLDVLAKEETELQPLLRREIMHIVAADLFTQPAPPRWAVLGMSIRMAGTAEVDRYRRTWLREWQAARSLPLTRVLQLQECSPQEVTAFCCASVCLVDFLVQKGGEKNFTLFLRDAQRYGIEAALRRQYGYENLAALEVAWRNWLLTGGTPR